MGNLRAGTLRHRVRFTRRREGQNELNEPHPDFVLLFEAWADVQPITGREVFTAAEHAQLLDTTITLRYLPFQQLTASDRAEVLGPQGGTYDIQNVLVPEQANEVLRVLARRVDHPPSPAAVPLADELTALVAGREAMTPAGAAAELPTARSATAGAHSPGTFPTSSAGSGDA